MNDKVVYKVLLPTDGSIPALAATKYAIELAKRMGGNLIVLFVKEPNPITQLEGLAMDTALMRTKVDGVEYAKKLAEEQNLPIEILTQEGAVAGEIIKIAEELKVDMIVMGSSNPKGLSGFFLGHVAEAVIKAVPYSVTVVKPTSKDTIELEAKAKMLVTAKVEHAIPKVENGMKFKVGLTLFALYALGYVVFTVLGTFNKTVFTARIFGLNWGILGGMAIILSAILIAVGYNWYAARFEKGEKNGRGVA